MNLSVLHAKLESKLQNMNPFVLLAVAGLCLVVFLVLRDHGVYATIMWDEWEYNRFARHLPLATADVPYYFYYFVYGATTLCGDHYLGCAHTLNAFFYAAALPFLYLVCRRTASQNISVVVAIAAVLGGTTVYATHFMPEPMYFCAFWMWAWAFLASVDLRAHSFMLGLGTGSSLALLSLVKLHAMFLVPGILLYFFVAAITGLLKGGMRNFVKLSILVLVSFLAVRFSVGYMIAGANGINIFGTAYGSKAHETFSSESLINLLQHAWPYMVGHMVAVASLFTIPVLLMGAIKFNPITAQGRRHLSLQIFTGCLLLPLIAVTAVYTARVSQLDPIVEGANGLLRLHMRYYSFLFPCFIMMAASVATQAEDAKRVNGQKMLVAVAAGLLAVGFVAELADFKLSVSDGSELRGFATIHPVAYFLTGLTLVSLLIWVRSQKAAARIYLLAFLPIFTLMGAAAAYTSAQKEKTPSVFHQAGLFAKKQLKEKVSQLAVVGGDFAGVNQAVFYADDPSIAYQTIPEGSCLGFVPSPQGKEWVLLVGNYKIQSPIDQKITEPTYSLVHTTPATVEPRPCVPEGK